MTQAEFIHDLRRHLRVGPFARRRILAEITDYLDSASNPRAFGRFGSPQMLAAEFNGAYESHWRDRMSWLTKITAVGLAMSLGICLLIFARPVELDVNVTSEIGLAIASEAVAVVCLLNRGIRLVGASMIAVAVTWLIWSVELPDHDYAAFCISLLVGAVTMVVVAERLWRALIGWLT